MRRKIKKIRNIRIAYYNAVKLANDHSLSDENLSYNEMVLKYVVSDDVYQSKTNCPKCGKEALFSSFEKLEGGCINQHYAISCKICGYNEDTSTY